MNKSLDNEYEKHIVPPNSKVLIEIFEICNFGYYMILFVLHKYIEFTGRLCLGCENLRKDIISQAFQSLLYIREDTLAFVKL